MKNRNTMWMFMSMIGIFAVGLSACGTGNASSKLTDALASQNETDGATIATVAQDEATASQASIERPQCWNEATHGKDVEPQYAVVFSQDAVNRIDITLSTEAWEALQGEMNELFGSAGEGNQRGAPGPGGQQPPDFTAGDADPHPDRELWENRPPGGGMGAVDFGDTSYVSSTIGFDGETWENVGFRYSGNSTLSSSWRNGTQKISFRLNFDKFEDEDASITDQRFYGFKKLAFKSNAMDDSYLREKVVADIFRDACVVSPQTAFYEVYLDHGEGPTYFGLYTLVEVVDDTVIKTQFSNDGGNVYKPEGSGAAFVDGTFAEDSFEKKTNENEGDWSDIQALFEALHSDLRSSDAPAWRASLEALFDVDTFIRWLAMDTVLQNWDTYGSMAHNYYLYTDPSDGLVTWIPWDNNMALSASSGPGRNGGDNGPQGMPSPGEAQQNAGLPQENELPPARDDNRFEPAAGAWRGRGGGMGGLRELDLSAVSERWPLIRFLMDDPVYQEKYRQDLQEIIQTVFVPQELSVVYERYHTLIAPSVQQESEGYTQLNSPDAFDQSLDELQQHAVQRYDAVVAYLASFD